MHKTKSGWQGIRYNPRLRVKPWDWLKANWYCEGVTKKKNSCICENTYRSWSQTYFCSPPTVLSPVLWVGRTERLHRNMMTEWNLGRKFYPTHLFRFWKLYKYYCCDCQVNENYTPIRLDHYIDWRARKTATLAWYPVRHIRAHRSAATWRGINSTNV